MIDTQYERYLKEILTTGTSKSDRTGTGTTSVFGGRLRYDLSQGLPVITTKEVHLKSVIHELLWFISGETNIKYLTDNGVRIWKEWADSEGNLGPVYGHQLRHWGSKGDHFVTPGIDQLAEVIKSLKENPDSRRHIISLWNVEDIPDMALPPCHGVVIQFYVANGKLSCQMYQRSADMFLGVPFNITFYSMLTHMVAQQAGLDVGELIWLGGDCHIYSNHEDQVQLQLTRAPYSFPKLELTPREGIDLYEYEDFKIVGYQHHERITGEVAV